MGQDKACCTPSIYAIDTLERAVEFIFSASTSGKRLPLPVSLDVELLRQRMRNKKSVLLSFPPKAGGTFLKMALKRSLGNALLLRGSITPLDQSINSIYYPAWVAALMQMDDSTVVSHVHLTPTETDADLMKVFGIRPVLMRRNILDSLVSIHDMIMAQENDPSFVVEKRGEAHQFGSAGPLPNYVRMAESEQKDFLVSNYAPWYIKYYSSWIYIAKRKALPVLWLSFDVFKEDEVGAIIGLLDQFGIAAPEADRIRLICRDLKAEGLRSRFKGGVSGRGAAFFDKRHVMHLHRLAAPYGFVDFAGEGLL